MGDKSIIRKLKNFCTKIWITFFKINQHIKRTILKIVLANSSVAFALQQIQCSLNSLTA